MRNLQEQVKKAFCYQTFSDLLLFKLIVLIFNLFSIFQVLANVVDEIGATSLSQYPFTHESLLVDRKEKKLSRMEKKIAERSFEAERHSQISYTRPSYAAYYPKGPEPPMDGPIYPHGAPLGLPGLPGGLPGLPGLPGLTPAPDFRNQNNIGPRKSGSYRPATIKPLNEQESLSFVKPKSQPVYNGMRESDAFPGIHILSIIRQNKEIRIIFSKFSI